MNYWFISDTHFNHKNILSFKGNEGKPLRPFSSIEEMDETLIDGWNKLVKPQDKIFHLGDVIMSSPKEFDKILSRLNGKKRLILGNHDVDKEKYLIPYFQKIHGVRHINIKGFKAILSHVPLHPDCIERFGVNVHGHTHCNKIEGIFVDGVDKPKKIKIKDGKRYVTGSFDTTSQSKDIIIGCKEDNRYINVCVEQTNYKPVNLDEIIK